MLDKDYKIPDCGKPSIFVGERQSSALVLLKKSLRSRVINESLHKLRGLVTRILANRGDASRLVDKGITKTTSGVEEVNGIGDVGDVSSGGCV